MLPITLINLIIAALAGESRGRDAVRAPPPNLASRPPRAAARYSTARALAAALLALSFSAGAAAEPRRVTKGGIDYFIDAVPAWVVRSAVPQASVADTPIKGPLRHALLDYQTSLLGATPERYMHHAMAVATASAVERAANVPIAFSPDSERLTLHSLAVLRAGQRIDKLPTTRVELLRRELGREALTYDGVVTADFVLDDVRAGDIVEVEYTLSGTNAVDGERFNTTYPLALAEPIDTLRVRVLSALDRPLRYSVLQADVAPRVTRGTSMSELTVRRENVPAIDLEPATPVDAAPFPRVRVSEYETWAQVANWADQVYRVPDDLSPALRRTIDDIRARSTSDSDAVRRALKFVQTEVRYVGVEIGEGSFRPTHPNQVLERRYGDCKDKALLLSAIVRALGYKAQPALVSTHLGHAPGQVLPMVRVFNHMIVMAEVGGRTYWLDATRTFQEGTLERIGNPQLRWALVTGDASQALTAIADGPEYQQRMDARYLVTIRDYREPVAFKLIATYSGITAESVRGALATQDHGKFAEAQLSDTRRWYPGVSPAGDMTVSDNIDTNVVTVTQAFTVRDFFEESAGVGVANLYADWIREFAQAPGKLERSAPLALVYPFALQMSFVVDFPDDIKLRLGAPISLSDDNLDFAVVQGYENNRLHVDYKLSTRRETVPAKDVKLYAEMLRAVRERFVYRVPVQKAQAVSSSFRQGAGLQAPALSRDDTSQIVAALDREQEGKVRALSEEIASGHLSGKPLADTLENRAIAYSNLDHTEPALADLTRAIALDPEAASARITRGEVHTKRGEYEPALVDFAAAARLEPGNEGLFRSRGHAYFLKGDYRAAQSDFRHVADRTGGEAQLHALIWLYLSSQRLGEDGRGIVAAIRSRADLSRWPGPAVMLFLGEATPEEMLAGAWSFDGKTGLLQRCEAYFFLGHYYLLEGDREKARTAFGESFATGVKTYLEYGYSRLELKRLGEKIAEEHSGK